MADATGSLRASYTVVRWNLEAGPRASSSPRELETRLYRRSRDTRSDKWTGMAIFVSGIPIVFHQKLTHTRYPITFVRLTNTDRATVHGARVRSTGSGLTVT